MPPVRHSAGCLPFRYYTWHGFAAGLWIEWLLMFERALIRRLDGSEIDIGLIAETIFFYGKTHLLLDRSLLLGLAQALSVSDLERLLESGAVQLSYKTGNFGVVSAGALRSHQFVGFFVGSKEKKKLSIPGHAMPYHNCTGF